MTLQAILFDMIVLQDEAKGSHCIKSKLDLLLLGCLQVHWVAHAIGYDYPYVGYASESSASRNTYIKSAWQPRDR